MQIEFVKGVRFCLHSCKIDNISQSSRTSWCADLLMASQFAWMLELENSELSIWMSILLSSQDCLLWKPRFVPILHSMPTLGSVATRWCLCTCDGKGLWLVKWSHLFVTSQNSHARWISKLGAFDFACDCRRLDTKCDFGKWTVTVLKTKALKADLYNWKSELQRNHFVVVKIFFIVCKAFENYFWGVWVHIFWRWGCQEFCNMTGLEPNPEFVLTWPTRP